MSSSALLSKYGTSDIFNTDRGSQFTSFAFTNVLRDKGIRISIKYENVYLHAYETGSEAREGIGKWIVFYNHTRPHSSLAGATPEELYSQKCQNPVPAAKSRGIRQTGAKTV
jgi:putative transposase